ncbi:MAG: thiosulfate oxidation carrier complex protein SoxZ [Gammaproteobacteria bacterium]|jgi:sulfur-oxidizing protein SoxZ|nr:thiosulfate oxidation carrier complex protein SoxZ [Gammaproteobacteria bacterium]
MKNSIRVRTEQKAEVTEVKMLIRHPMETGLRKDSKTGELVPAHFITEVVCKHNDADVFTAYWGIAVSKNPFLSFTLDEVKPGDVLAISWQDNKGGSDSVVVDI